LGHKALNSCSRTPKSILQVYAFICASRRKAVPARNHRANAALLGVRMSIDYNHFRQKQSGRGTFVSIEIPAVIT
jgi:hypothetical protein